MLQLNKVMLCGRLTSDPELKTTPSGISVTSFKIAVNKPYKSGEEKEADFIDIVAWRSTAEFITKYFKKGTAIYIGGAISTRTYKDKDGNNRKVVEVVTDEVKFAEIKPKSEETFSSNAEEFTEVGDNDELPF